MAIQLFGASLIGTLVGRQIDTWLGLERPTFAVFLTIIFMVGVLYSIYRQLLKE